MLERLFPRSLDNTFPGHPVSLWVFYALTAMTLWRSQHHIFASDGGAQSIATIPLDSYSQGASETIIGIFALWGHAQLGMAFIMLIACIRYKALIPLLWLFAVFEYSGRFAISLYKPIETVGIAPGENGNMILPWIALIMLAIALWPRKNGQGETKAD